MKKNHWAIRVLCIFVGLLFLLSAYAKVDSLDAYEILMHRLISLHFDVVSILGRLLIGFEALIGLAFIFRWYLKAFWRAGLVFLLASLAVWAVLIFQGDDSDYTFISFRHLGAIVFLAKNALLVALLLAVRHLPSVHFRYQAAVLGVLGLFVFSLPFILSPPDMFLQEHYQAKVQYDQVAIDSLFITNDLPDSLAHGKVVIGFLSPHCRFCKMSTTRVSVMINRAEEINKEDVFYAFWAEDEQEITGFYHQQYSLEFKHAIIPPKGFLKATTGSMPLFVLLEDGQVKGKMNYRTLNEGVVADFLKE